MNKITEMKTLNDNELENISGGCNDEQNTLVSFNADNNISYIGAAKIFGDIKKEMENSYDNQ